ncbi:MAG TPA: tetratricopeptide repeat protein [Patescibacteria group bacterium]|nr:tetratricopeptide repeat protein [Patescibacteria group bacterium]
MAETNVSTNNNQTQAPPSPKKIGNIIDNKNLPKVAIIAAVILLVILGIVFVLRPKKSDTQVVYLQTQADLATKKADFKKSQELLSQALKIQPNNPQSLTQMINAISLQGNQAGKEDQALKNSQPYIDTALSAAPKDVAVLISVGYAYETAGDYNNALKYYQEATDVDPKSSAAWFHLGHVLQFLGRNSEAYQNYDKALSLDPNNALAIMGKAGQDYSNGQVQKAYDEYVKAAQVELVSDQNKAEALSAAANIRRYQDNFIHMDESISLSKKAVDTDPTFSPALAAYGNNLFLTNKPDEGESYMLKAISANPRISVNYSDLGIDLRGIKRYQDAINYQKQAIEKVPNDNTILMPADRLKMEGYYNYELAKTYSMAGLNVDTVSLLQRAVQLNPALKAQIKNDYNSGYFGNLSGNNGFQTLISS